MKSSISFQFFIYKSNKCVLDIGTYKIRLSPSRNNSKTRSGSFSIEAITERPLNTKVPLTLRTRIAHGTLMGLIVRRTFEGNENVNHL